MIHSELCVKESLSAMCVSSRGWLVCSGIRLASALLSVRSARHACRSCLLKNTCWGPGAMVKAVCLESWRSRARTPPGLHVSEN